MPEAIENIDIDQLDLPAIEELLVRLREEESELRTAIDEDTFDLDKDPYYQPFPNNDPIHSLVVDAFPELDDGDAMIDPIGESRGGMQKELEQKKAKLRIVEQQIAQAERHRGTLT